MSGLARLPHYYRLLSEQWQKLAFRPGFSSYNYVVILDKKLVVFHSNGPANPAKFKRIRPQLLRNLSTTKTDLHQPHLLLGYKKSLTIRAFFRTAADGSRYLVCEPVEDQEVGSIP